MICIYLVYIYEYLPITFLFSHTWSKPNTHRVNQTTSPPTNWYWRRWTNQTWRFQPLMNDDFQTMKVDEFTRPSFTISTKSRLRVSTTWDRRFQPSKLDGFNKTGGFNQSSYVGGFNQSSLTVSSTKLDGFINQAWRFLSIKLDGFNQSSSTVSTNQDWRFQQMKTDGFNKIEAFNQSSLTVSTNQYFDGFNQSIFWRFQTITLDHHSWRSEDRFTPQL